MNQIRSTLLPCAIASFLVLHGRSDIIQTAKLVPPDPTGGDRFGVGVAVSGDTLVVTAPEHRTAGKFGAAYVYTSGDSGWEFQAKLVSPHPRPFATSVALDGQNIVLGGLEDHSEFGGVDAGLAFVYTFSGGNWTLAAELAAPDAQSPNRTANSVAIKDGTIVIGAQGDNTFGVTAGAAYVFTQADGSWSFQQKLYASQMLEGAAFGSAAEINGDTLAIAANFDLSGQGSVHLFQRENGIWTHEERIVAPDASTGSVFGRSIALSDDYLLVGRTDDHDVAPGAGAAYVFQLLPDSREFMQKLYAADASPFAAFGTSVAIADREFYVGAPSAPWQGTSTIGSVYTFSLVGDVFQQAQQIVAQDPTPFSGFGWSAAADGDVLAVGAIFQEVNGVAYTFQQEQADTEVPVIQSVTASPGEIFPPNRKLIPVTVEVVATDNSGVANSRIVSVAVDDPSSIRREPAYQITGDLTVDLRAERNARGQLRTYTITVETTDDSGNATTSTVEVRVL